MYIELHYTHDTEYNAKYESSMPSNHSLIMTPCSFSNDRQQTVSIEIQFGHTCALKSACQLIGPNDIVQLSVVICGIHPMV